MVRRVYTKGDPREMAKNIMSKSFIAIDESTKVSDAFELVTQKADEANDLHAIYVTWNNQLVGILSLRQIMAADENVTLRSIMNSGVISVSEETDQEEIANLIQDNNVSSVPVVTKERNVVGVVTIEQAMDILRDEATEDMYKSVGMDISKASKGTEENKKKEYLRSDTLVNGSIRSIWKIRLPILIIALITGFFAGTVMAGFEETLDAVVAVAFFIPLIMDVGGDIGGQSTTTFARGFVLGHIKPERFLKHLSKEAGIGLALGVCVGILAGIAAFLWLGDIGLAVALALAILTTCTVAACLGFVVPMVLLALGVDQSANSGPIITAIKDITGLLIYFYAVTIFVDITAFM